MKILIITAKYYPDTFPINLISEELSRKGNEVDVLTSVPFRDGKYIDNYDKEKSFENGVNIFRVKTKIRTTTKSSLVKYYLSLHKEFKNWVKKCNKKYDVVFSYSISPVITLAAGNLYKKLHNVPHVAHVLDIWPESVVDAGYTSSHSILYRVLRKWSKKEYEGVDKLLIGSESFKDYLVNKLDIDPNKISFLVQPGLIYKEDVMGNPYDVDKTNVIYCGNISKLQLVDLIIPAMEKLRNNDVVFNILGTGSYLEEFKEELKRTNLSNVVYRGYYNYQESAGYLRSSDAILVSLKNVGFVGKTIPNKLISALYYAKPIIGMISGEGRDILAKNDNIIVNESVDDLVNGINKLIALSDKDRIEIGKKNRQQYDDLYSIDKYINNLLGSFSSK